MTTHQTPHPDDNHDDRPPADPLRPDHLACGCGATADRDGQCRKCRARARWDRRNSNRRVPTDRPPTRSREPRHPAGRARRTGR